MVAQMQRDTRAALRSLRRLLRNQHVGQKKIVTDGPRSCPAALEELSSTVIVPAVYATRLDGRQHLISTQRCGGSGGSRINNLECPTAGEQSGPCRIKISWQV
jgi:hypothetical protein